MKEVGTLQATRVSRAMLALYLSVLHVMAAAGGTVASHSLEVDSRKGWVSSGVFIREGVEQLRIGATGSVTACKPSRLCGNQKYADRVGPEGLQKLPPPPGAVSAQSPPMSLLGRVGSGAPFLVGKEYTGRPPGAGILYFSVNDNHFGDNDGVFNATIEYSERDQGSASLQVAFLGIEGDHVGPQGYATANGRDDGHFRVGLDVGEGSRTVRYIRLWSADTLGDPTGGRVWDTAPGGFWTLGVYRDGQRLNPKDEGIDDEIKGVIEYDFFAEDAGWFTLGKTLGVTVAFDDGSWVARSTMIAEDIKEENVSAPDTIPGSVSVASRQSEEPLEDAIQRNSFILNEPQPKYRPPDLSA